MRKTLTLCTAPAGVAIVALLISGASSAPPNGFDVPDPSSTPETLTLSGTIRDFQASHPDFEEPIPDFEEGRGLDNEITTSRLGPDRKPVYASATDTITTSGADNFNQWYRDTPGINQSTKHEIVLEGIPGTNPTFYRYENVDFYPIDDRLGGNEGQSHNYLFTYELHNTFTYRGGEVFSLASDDDSWVYINNQKVLDSGGLHPPLWGTVRLDNVAEQLDLVKGESYNLDIFSAERHTDGSAFLLQTSIVLEPPGEEPPLPTEEPTPPTEEPTPPTEEPTPPTQEPTPPTEEPTRPPGKKP